MGSAFGGGHSLNQRGQPKASGFTRRRCFLFGVSLSLGLISRPNKPVVYLAVYEALVTEARAR